MLAAQEGARSQPCVIIFLFVYFFGNAISAWWTLVAFSWALAQHCSPNKASMHRISMICHMYGWGVPAILTLVALLTHSIEADELTSICLPGMFNVLQSVTFMFTFWNDKYFQVIFDVNRVNVKDFFITLFRSFAR